MAEARKHEDADRGWHKHLGFLIHDVARLRSYAFDRLMKPLGMTRSQWWVVAHLLRRDGTTQTQLAEILEMSPMNLVGLLDRLERTGWVERRADPHDRRVKRVFLTSRIESIKKEMETRERFLNRQCLAGLTVEEYHQLVDLLATVKDNLSETDMQSWEQLDFDNVIPDREEGPDGTT